MKSILITGGTGSFGTAFVKRLLNIGVPRICILSRGEHRQTALRQSLDSDPRLRWFIGDVRNPWRLIEAMEDVEIVVHAAALKDVYTAKYNPDEVIETNINGTRNIIRAAKANKVRKVVLISTDKAFQPINLYGATKFAAEGLFEHAHNTRGIRGPRFIRVRYGNIWKSNGSVIPKWIDSFRERGVVEVTDPNCTRFFMTVDEAGELVWQTIQEDGEDLVIPKWLPAYDVGTAAAALGAKVIITGLGKDEKLHESICNGVSSDIARRMTVEEIRGHL